MTVILIMLKTKSLKSSTHLENVRQVNNVILEWVSMAFQR